ncbi:alpha/beta fold hydrolase [Luteimicrobium sp. DT211]|uniref:alpha/beta fold hydrolase n=1 Tax=Luteimicrobium sp. DT211 TaxID=3393412 RepID=UPI003CE988BD
MHVEERGTGTPVVLIHGAGVDHRILLPLEPVFEESGGWRRLYVDLPGMGRSPVGDVASSDDMADAMLREVRERLGDEPFAVVGNSYGAMIARRLVAELPGQVLGLAAIAGVFVATHAERTAPPRTVLHVEPGLLDGVDPAVAEGYTEIAVVQTREGLASYERYVHPGVLTVDTAGLARLGERYAFAAEPEDTAPPFAGPALFLCGRQDDVVGYADAWDRLEHYPHASLVVLDRAGHNVLLEQPEQAGAAVAEWLGRVREATGPVADVTSPAAAAVDEAPSSERRGAVQYTWRGHFEDEEVNALHAEAFEHDVLDDAWHDQLERHSLGWVVARDARGLVGFVNVVGDGSVHAFVEDTAVASRRRREGIGVRLIEVAREQAAAAGCEWLHVDFDPHLRSFYYDACGFTPTDAGLIRLR